MSESKFWLVWSPQGNSPTKRHATKKSADDEAERLAKLNRSNKFYVLEAVTSYRVCDLVVEQLTDEIPF